MDLTSSFVIGGVIFFDKVGCPFHARVSTVQVYLLYLVWLNAATVNHGTYLQDWFSLILHHHHPPLQYFGDPVHFILIWPNEHEIHY